MSILDLEMPHLPGELARNLTFEGAREMCLKDESLYLCRSRCGEGFSVFSSASRSRKPCSADQRAGYERDTTMHDIYEAVSGGSGDGYLGDGMWIGAGGGVYDRGR